MDEPRACHDMSCINVATYVECAYDMCPAGKACQNQRLQHPDRFPRIEPFPTDMKGYGVRTLDFICAGGPVGEYVGEVINQKEFDRRCSAMSRHEINFYFIQMEPGIFNDARYRGGFTRFVNHSCQPNCKAEKWTVKGVTRLLVFALRDIQPMEEITFDYQWKSLGRIRQKYEHKNCECFSVSLRATTYNHRCILYEYPTFVIVCKTQGVYTSYIYIYIYMYSDLTVLNFS
jgi:hypothetical protein